jgi:hypothetical protein
MTTLERESDVTWDIIAELSKNETTDVYTMLLNYYEKCETAVTATTATTTSNMYGSKYLIYPEDDIKQLFIEFNMIRFYNEFYEESTPTTTAPDADSLLHKKKKGRGKKTTPSVPTRERIRREQVRVHAFKQKALFPKKCKGLAPAFHSNVIEVIILYYLNVTHSAYTKQRTDEFMNAVLSLRDAFVYFETQLSAVVKAVVRKYFIHIQTTFPWKSFLSSHTRYLLRNHFKDNFQKAPRPFKEQANLLKQIRHESAHTLFVLPWGVGTGKTAMLPPLAEIYRQRGYQTLYCVPFGPVRDQAAALLYRCGIPFAYVVPATNSCPEDFELQPSFMCGEGVVPVVYIVHPQFVKHYIQFWDTSAVLMDGDLARMDITENPPSVALPNYKSRYAHLNHTIWNLQYTLIIDEPCENDADIMWMMNNLPETTFVMSATSWGLVTDSVRDMYSMRYSGTPCTIDAHTVGVSTTLIGYWLDDRPVLSPFSGVVTAEAFRQRTAYIRHKILWRRFLSANVMVNWIHLVQTICPPAMAHLSYEFDLYSITFDSLSERVLQWCDALLTDSTLDDSFYAAMFTLPSVTAAPLSAILPAILGKESAQFLGGCVIGVPNVDNAYSQLTPLLQSFPTIQAIDKKIERYQKSMLEQYALWKKIPVTKPTDLRQKQENLQNIENKRVTTLPVAEDQIINTAAYIERMTRMHAPSTNKLTRVQELFEVGDPLKDPDGWRIFADKMSGNFETIHEDKLRWRWKGVGSIGFHKEFNMKNIRDSDGGYLAFLLIDAIGAHGLNLKIKHGILMKGEDGSMLSPSTCLQLAGRVGRWGQDSTGFVYITDPDIFEMVFAH